MVSDKKRGFAVSLIKCIIFSAVACMAMLLLLSLAATLFGAGKTAMRIFSVTVKIVVTATAAFALSDGTRGIFKGLLAGVLSFFIVFALFSVFSPVKNAGALALELLFFCVFGIIFGIIFANLKNKDDNA